MKYTSKKSVLNAPKYGYNPNFVKKIKNAEKRAEFTTIDTTDVWGSLGLKRDVIFKINKSLL